MGGAWGFFPYEAMDYKAAQACLDRRAAAGWPFLSRPMYRCATVSTGAIRAGTTGPATALCWPTRGGGCASG